jgi:hypothetical protein
LKGHSLLDDGSGIDERVGGKPSRNRRRRTHAKEVDRREKLILKSV